MSPAKSPSNISERFQSKAAATVREEIAACSGAEVFFVGRRDATGMVESVEVWARGNDSAVPALADAADVGDVVIHNHPTGILSPSDADLAVASRLGASGVGFYIVDNDCRRVYAVVEAPEQPDLIEPLDPEAVAAVLGPEGELARIHPNYEPRESQAEMAGVIAGILDSDAIGILEAGTGTGKSLAYLVPAVQWALKGRRRVVVSTRTINLQEQHLQQDLPLLTGIIGEPFKAAIFKGRGNYLCLRKRDLMGADSGQTLLEFDDFREASQIIKWSRTTRDGSLSDLPFVPAESNWALFRSESDSCLRARCPHFAGCFFYAARREGASAQLLLSNHHVLFADLALRAAGQEAAAIMPAYDAVILDEAHNVENVAISYFGAGLTRWAILSHLGRLVSRRNREKGLLPFLLRRLGFEKALTPEAAEDLKALTLGLIEEVSQRRTEVDGLMTTLAERLQEWLGSSSGRGGQGKGESRWRIPLDKRNDPRWDVISSLMEEITLNLKGALTPLRKIINTIRDLMEEGSDELAGVWGDLGGIYSRIEGAVQFLRRAVDGEDEGEVFWAEVRRGRGDRESLSLHLTPLDASPILKETLFSAPHPVVLTSATLTVGDSFDFMCGRLGIQDLQDREVVRRVFRSPFSLAEQMTLAVPEGIPEPGREGYIDGLARSVEKLAEAAGGGMLGLFTSYRTMDKVYDSCLPRLEALGLTALRQGEAPRTILLEQFRADPESILFATDSFWEGVDVVGSSLKCVVIARLPFPVPTDPVNEARGEALARIGKDPFMEDSVPRAVIKFRQGVGRLIRHRDDSGFAVVCDVRIIKRPYGSIFINSLGDLPLERAALPALVSSMRSFFHR